MTPPPRRSTLFPYTTLFRSVHTGKWEDNKTERIPDGKTWLTLKVYLTVPPTSDVGGTDRKSTRLNSSHMSISYAVFCLKKKKNPALHRPPRPNQEPDIRHPT